MKTITISGTQGAGKTTMAQLFLEWRRGAALRLEAEECKRPGFLERNLPPGQQFKTIVVEDVTGETADDFGLLTRRLTYDGVLVLVKVGGL